MQTSGPTRNPRNRGNSAGPFERSLIDPGPLGVSFFYPLSILDSSLSNLVLIQTAALEISVTTASVYPAFAPFKASVEISAAPRSTLL